MNWIFSCILLSVIISWGVTLKYQHIISTLKDRLFTKEESSTLEKVKINEILLENTRLEDENSRLRRMLG